MKLIHAEILTLCLALGAGALKAEAAFPLKSMQAENPAVTAAADDSLVRTEITAKQMRAFMKEEIVCNAYVFPPGEFPVFWWKNEQYAESLAGPGEIKVKFYDAAFNEVTEAKAPGRYGAVAECTTRDGFRVRRYITLYCAPAEFDDYSLNVPIKINNLPAYGIADDKWAAYERNLERYSFGSMKMFPLTNPESAVFLAGLSEMSGRESIHETPRLNDRRWWIKLKGKLSPAPVNENSLAVPAKKKKKALTDDLKAYSAKAASSYGKGKIQKLRDLLSQWAGKEKTPCVTAVVHKGRIIFHETFGKDEAGKPLTVKSNMWMASITKMLTGTLMMQFVSRGLIDLDAPVSKYLPELKENMKGIPSDRLTVRHLLNHTSGLHIAGEWASDWNYSLENQAAQILPYLNIDKEFSYHRGGYALAGKIMERLTGRALPDLFRSNIFQPLEMKSAYSDNSYGGLYCTAEDLARFGMMLMQKGTFNGTEILPEDAFNKMLPAEIPYAGRKWGMGTTAYSGNGLSTSAFGHGAASGTIFRIDPVNELIIISARNAPGRNYNEYEKKLIESCTDLIKQP